MIIKTIADLCAALPEIYGQNPFLSYRKSKTWIPVSVEDAHETIYAIVMGLRKKGIAKGDHVSLLCNTTHNWTLIDFGIEVLGAVNVPIYPTLTIEQIEHIVSHSDSRLVFMESPQQYKKMSDFFKNNKGLICVLINKPSIDIKLSDNLLTLEQLIALGKAAIREQGIQPIKDIISKITENDIASILYTSGTTGEPKGVVLTHGNIMSNVLSANKRLDMDNYTRSLVFLPLSHAYARTCNYIMMKSGITLYYAQNIGTIARDIMETRPECLAGVPRIFEKVYESIKEGARNGGKLKVTVFNWAKNIAIQTSKKKIENKSTSLLLNIQHAAANRLVYKRIKEKLGGKLRFIQSGSAAIVEEIAHFFNGLGIDYLEGYGLTEASPIITANSPHCNKVGTVGYALDGVDLQIRSDGELLVKGPNIMKGYYKDYAATRDVFTPDGWFMTGDICEIMPNRCVKIIDRKKDLMKTSSGKYIAPQKIEMIAKQNRYIEEFIVIAEMMRFPAALIVPDYERLKEYIESNNIEFTDKKQLLKHETIRNLFKSIIDNEININLAQFEQIVKFILIEEPFSIEEGSMTPTLKVRRKVVYNMYHEEIKKLYEESA